MMLLPVDFFEYLRQRVQISEVVSTKVVLRNKAGEFLGLCPFHHEKSPSFTVNNQKKFYHCFGCGAHGDIMKFISELDGITYSEAAVKIAKQNSIALPQLNKEQQKIYKEIDDLQVIMEMAQHFFAGKIKKHQESINYLSKRSISPESIKNFSIGYAPKNSELQSFLETQKVPLIMMEKAGLVNKYNSGYSEFFRDRIIFPIKNIYNKTIAFGGRAFGDVKPKYLNSPETLLFNKKEVLYAEDRAFASSCRKNRMIIVEGYIDVIAMHQAEIYETVATLGTAVTEHHINRIWRNCDEIIFCLDGDLAGRNAARKTIDLITPMINSQKQVKFISIPNNYDPDDYIKSYGKESMHNLISEAKTMSLAVWENSISDVDEFTAENYALIESKLNSYVKLIKDPTLAKNYNQFFKDQLWQLRSQKYKKDGQKKVIKENISQEATLAHDYSEIEHLENSIISFVMQFPQIFQSESSLEFISTLEFSSEELNNFRDIILKEIDNFQLKEEEKLINRFKKAGFFDLFILLSNPKNIFLDINIDERNLTNIWDLILKKYQLALLKEEYKEYVVRYGDSKFDVIIEFSRNISKLQSEINLLLDQIN